jgi:hypothetical protein
MSLAGGLRRLTIVDLEKEDTQDGQLIGAPRGEMVHLR